MRVRTPREAVRDTGRWIAHFRTAAGDSQEALAEKLSVSPQYVSSVERGRENLTIETITRWAIALHVDPGDLMARPTGVITRQRVRRKPRRP